MKFLQIKRSHIRKGMVMASPLLNPQACWEFEGEILVLHHPTTIAVRYQAMSEYHYNTIPHINTRHLLQKFTKERMTWEPSCKGIYWTQYQVWGSIPSASDLRMNALVHVTVTHTIKHVQLCMQV